MRASLLWVALLGGSAMAAPPVSEVIFPPQRLPLRFSHQKHLQQKIECDFCHERAPQSSAASDNLLPSEEVCSTCHPIDREHPERASRSATACAQCHPGFAPGHDVERLVIPTPNLRFSHRAHTDKGIGCVRCHGGLDRTELATRAQLPKMELCLGCHNSRRGGLNAPSRCATCHLSQADGTLQQLFAAGTLRPSGQLRGDAHTLDFRTHHAQAARGEEGYCKNCHREDFCLSCHDGVVKPFDFHGNDYLSRHPIEARRNDPDCNACHRRQSFCLGCHERLGIVDARTGVSDGFAPLGVKRFHPDGWADASAANQPNHHAWQAQRNLKQCVSCHRQETCLECHGSRDGAGAAGKMQVNPHPPNWRGSMRCQALADRNVRMCLKCHAAGDALLHCR